MDPDRTRGLRASRARVGLSTASVYPEGTPVAFELAAKLGYDGVEVMVWTDPVSQDPYALQRLSQHYQVPILAIHAPCLIITQRVWTTDPWTKLQKAQFAAELLGAQTVVVHPPFRWQRDYARGFREGVRPASRRRPTSASRWRTCSRCGCAAGRCRPTSRAGTSPVDDPYRDYTLDLSHTAVSQSDALAMLDGDGRAARAPAHRRRHRADQGRASRPGPRHASRAPRCWNRLAARGFDGHIIVEINTRRALDRAEREADLAEALAFCRLHLVAPRADARPERAAASLDACCAPRSWLPRATRASSRW